ncbi:hypothetical protein H4R27_000090 [Coemansia aciculifera]|nr:hypothetical protein H4R27_000090 [Coemansia aciculifera]
MAQFFIPAAPVDSTGHYYHPAIRHDLALDMSLKKLSDMKSTQRATHRPANLLKTVLVYNMFKAAVAPLAQVAVPAPVPESVLDMDVDEPESGAAAEQSWFDRCIDNMLTEDSQDSMDLPTSSFCIGDDEDDEEEEEEEYGENHGQFSCGGALKRSPSFQSLRMLGQQTPAVDSCLPIAAAAPAVAAAEDMTPGAWQKAGLWPTRDPQTIHANFFS